MRFRISAILVSGLLSACVAPGAAQRTTAGGPGALNGRASVPPYVRGGYPGRERVCENRDPDGNPVTYNC